MKDIRAEMNEYDLELQKEMDALQRLLLGLQSSQSSNNALETENDTDVPPLPPEDSGKEENDPDVPPLNPADNYRKENDTDFPPLPSIDNGEEENDPELTPLTPVKIPEEVKTSNDMSVKYRDPTLPLGSQVRKFFEGIGWFYGEFVDYFLDEDNNQMYTIIFTDGEE